MNAREFMTGAAFIVSIMAVLAAFEAAVPLFPRGAEARGRHGANLGLMAITFAINWVLTSAAALVAVMQGPGILAGAGLAPLLQLAFSIVVLDFCFGYVAHVALHAVPSLWPAHRVHHTDPFVDVTTTYRTHPVESVWRSLFIIGPVWLLAVPPEALIAYRILSAVNGLLEHANVRVPVSVDSVVSAIWVTPNMHKIHHSRERAETNSNYGNLLSIYDRLFRTFVPTRRTLSVAYGLEDTEPGSATSLRRLLALRTRARMSRRARIGAGVGLMMLGALSSGSALGQQPPTVLFMCPHGAAKSVLASAYFQRMAKERGLNVRIVSGGTQPQETVSPLVAAHLARNGYAVPAEKPRAVTPQDVENADVAVSMGCDVSQLPIQPGTHRTWDEVPGPSEDLAGADEAIKRRVRALVEELLARRK